MDYHPESAERSVTQLVAIDPEPCIVRIDKPSIDVDKESVTSAKDFSRLACVNRVLEDLQVTGKRPESLVD
jgi:hypothetical protein